jgi:hypothetical protein
MHKLGRFWFLFIELAREREDKPPTLIGAVDKPPSL